MNKVKTSRPTVAERIERLREIASETSDNAALALLRACDDRSSWVRAQAIELFQDQDKALARVAARSGLSDSIAWVRARSIETLGWCGTRRDIPLILPFLNDADWDTRTEAISVVGCLGDRREAPILAALLDTEEDDIAVRSIGYAIGRFGDESYRSRLLNEAEKREDEIAQIGLLYGAYLLGETEVFDRMLDHLNSDDYLVQYNVFHSFEPEELSPEDVLKTIDRLLAFIQRAANNGVMTDAKKVLESLERSLVPAWY